MNPRRCAAVVATASVALLSLVACSSESTPDGPGTPPSSSAFPVSVPGALGSAEITEQPNRVVALTWTDADIVFSLGVTPISVQKAQTDSGYQPWFESAVGAGDLPPVWDGTDGGVSVEEIAALQPDLIVATKAFNLDRTYEQLSQVAPVVHFADTPSSETWQSATTTVAAALGKSEKGEQVVADTESRIADAAQQNGALDGKSFTFFVGPTAESVYVVNSSQDAGASFLDQVGMAPTEFATSQPESTIPGRAQISYELLSQTDADVVIATGRPGTVEELAARPAAAALPALVRGAFVELSPTQAQSIAFPSPLSLGWALDEIVPRLDAAAQK